MKEVSKNLLNEELTRIKSMMGIINEISVPVKNYTKSNGWIQTGSHCDSPTSYSDNIRPDTQHTDNTQGVSKDNITYEYYKIINPETGLCSSNDFDMSVEVKTSKRCITGTGVLSFEKGDAVLKGHFNNNNMVENIFIQFCKNIFTEQDVRSICGEFNGDSDISNKFYCLISKSSLSVDQLTKLVSTIQNRPAAQNKLNTQTTTQQPYS